MVGQDLRSWVWIGWVEGALALEVGGSDRHTHTHIYIYIYIRQVFHDWHVTTTGKPQMGTSLHQPMCMQSAGSVSTIKYECSCTCNLYSTTYHRTIS